MSSRDRSTTTQYRYITGAGAAANSPAFADAEVLASDVAAARGAANALWSMGGSRGLLLFPFATGDDNGTFTIKVWRYSPQKKASGQDGTSSDVVSYQRVLFATLACTLSTAVGSANALVGASERYADTIAVTVSAAATVLCNGLGVSVPAAHSPADNTPAFCMVPDLCDGGFFQLEFVTFTSVTAGNALVEYTE